MPYQLTKRQKKSFQGIFIGFIIGNLIFEAGKFQLLLRILQKHLKNTGICKKRLVIS